jgi:replicative DNA helicase
MGKTALADNIAANVAAGNKVVGFFSMEMDPAQIAARVLSRRSGSFSYSKLRSFTDRPHPSHVEPLVADLPEGLLIDPTGAQTLAGLEASARAMKRQTRQLDLILVDYLQLMRDAAARRDGRTQELSEITAGLKSLAKRLSVPIIALSQLSRQVENREDKRPQLSDLRESGSIEQDADIVLFVYREHYYLERNEPQPQAKEKKEDFSARKAKYDERLILTANTFEIFTGKNRHGAGGREEFYCDLSMDMIADEQPISHIQTPRAFGSGQDGAS